MCNGPLHLGSKFSFLLGRTRCFGVLADGVLFMVSACRQQAIELELCMPLAQPRRDRVWPVRLIPRR